MLTKLQSEKIVSNLSRLDVHDYGDVLQCMRCGTCLPTCPTYRTDAIETQSPRGRVAMIKAVINGDLSPSEEFIEHMYHCLDCRNCQTVCPAAVKVGELVLEARHCIEESLPQPLIKRIMLDYAIKDQKILNKMMIPMRLYQKLGLQWLVRKSHILHLISDDLEFMEAILPDLPVRPLTDSIPEIMPAFGAERGRVGFFLGCAMNLIFSDVSRDTIYNLRKAGFTVIIPKDQQCCGTPNIAEGERTVYRAMADHNIGLFSGKHIDFVVTDCAACGSELKTYKEMLSKKWNSQRAEEFSNKVKDVSEFMDFALDGTVPLTRIKEKMCFHDPCHLRHGQKLVLPQRNILKRIPDLVYTDIPDDGQCCGSAGIYNITHRERSVKILDAKVSAIDKTGAQRIVTSNPGCYMQLLYAQHHWGKPWRVSHISQIIRQSLEG